MDRGRLFGAERRRRAPRLGRARARRRAVGQTPAGARARVAERPGPDPIALFLDEEGGYTSLAVACALLASLALVFSLAQAQWTAGRAADVQAVADAAALSGARAVRAFSTAAQACDATVLSLGLCGLVVMGAGAVATLVPGMGATGLKVVDAGRSVLSSRKRFAESSARGLQKLEAALPAAIAANSWATVSANSAGGVSYAGAALPFPEKGQSEYGLADDVDAEAEQLEESAEKLAEAAKEAESAKRALDEALERGWRADCVDDPSCACSRAERLAGLAGGANPRYSHVEAWNFGVALRRARAYYGARIAQEAPAADTVEERANSALRMAFYRYALEKTQAGSYRESGDEAVADLPELPRNAQTTRESELYTRALWPCSQGSEGAVLHAYQGCPGSSGTWAGRGSLAALEAGEFAHCDVCSMDVADLGAVAAASTSIPNGFEHYWKKIVEASRDWKRAHDEYRAAKRKEEELAEGQASIFERALKALAVPRPKLLPPGAYGCVAVALRPGDAAVPAGLTGGFAQGGSLPAGVAIAGATLAPDDATAENSVLARFFDSVSQGEEGGVAGVLQGVTRLWGQLLLGYGKAFDGASGAANSLLDGLEGVGAGTVARWLKDKIGGLVAAAGFEPADVRLRKPVLCNTQDILDKDGRTSAGDVRSLLLSLPAAGSPRELLAALGRRFEDELGEQELTMAELEVPGTSIKVPITVRLKDLWGAT